MPTVGPGLPPLSPPREEFRSPAGQGSLLPIIVTSRGKAFLQNVMALPLRRSA